MCGIFGIVSQESYDASSILDGLKTLEYRGYDSWGIAVSEDGVLAVDKHVGKIGEARTILAQTKIGIGHTRWATHGGVTNDNAHPHLDCSKKVAVVHNGIVENYQELKHTLLQNGHTFVSETDSEVISHMVEEELRAKDLKTAVCTVFKKLVGSNALVVLDLEHNEIAAVRDGSPLVAGFGTDRFFIASDVTAFLPFTKQVLFLDDGEGVIITNRSITLFDLKTEKPKQATPETLDWKAEDAKKDGFAHFMLKEIMEQIKTIPKTAALNHAEIAQVAQKIKDGYKVVITACGSAYFCGVAAKYLFASAGFDVQVYGAYEFLPFADFVDEKTVFIAISQSGETADTIIATKKAKANGAFIVSVVNARGSTLERLSDSSLSVGSGPEIAVVATKSFTAQLATLYLLSKAASNRLEEGQSNITTLGATLHNWVTQKTQDTILELAKKLVDAEHVYVIGKHLNYPAAMECALKMKEASYIHAEHFASGELKHGVIALIEKGTPCIVLASEDEVKREALSSAAELKARGATIIGIAPFKASEFDMHIKTPDVGQLTFILNIVVGQLLGYYLSVGVGADPDKPRNLAKSVTVE
jgi:glucosamine--fructose-6-phosphate aminotransferase (isomerizing)